jgi:hypothetical protein
MLSMAISKIVSMPYRSRAGSHAPPCAIRWMMPWHAVAGDGMLGWMDDCLGVGLLGRCNRPEWGRLSTSRRPAQSSPPGCRLRPSPSVEADSEATFRRPIAPSCPIPPLGARFIGVHAPAYRDQCVTISIVASYRAVPERSLTAVVPVLVY